MKLPRATFTTYCATLMFMLLVMTISTTSLPQYSDAYADSPAHQISQQVCGDENDGTPRIDKAEVVIQGPDKVKVGDLIVLDLSDSLGAGFDYQVIPEPPGLQVFNNGRTIVCGTGDENIEYLFMISCALDGDSDIKTHIVRVYGAVVGPPPSPGQNMVQKVKDWCDDVDSPNKHDDAIALAQSFSSVAIIIEQNTFSDPAELVRATSTSNRDALRDNLEHWTPLLDSLMMELKAMSDAGQLPDIQSHVRIWKDVAQGLREYAANMN